MSAVVHYLDPKTMAYTACKLLPTWSRERQWSANREDVTCPRCLAPEDAEGCRLLYGREVLMPNGKKAIVMEATALPVPEVLVVYKGQQVRIPAEEVALL